MDIDVRPLEKADLGAADAVHRAAFGRVLGPGALGDTDLLRSRFRALHVRGFGAHVDGELVGSAFAARWGSVGYLGPISVAPDLWGIGIGSRLIEACLVVLEDAAHLGLFTFAHSARHHALYQRFGFWPRFLTAIMSVPVVGSEPALGRRASTARGHPELHAGAAAVTGAIMPGLDVSGEIDSVLDHGLGDVVLVGERGAPSGFAVCHTGAGTEAGSGVVYVKFAAVAPGPAASDAFAALLAACRGYAAEVGAYRLTAGVNTARHQAYRQLLAAGFRTDQPGVTMHRPNEPGYDREDVLLLDDWR